MRVYLPLILISNINGQPTSLKLFDYNQSLCITDCTDGLRHRVDKLVLIGQVNWKNIPAEYTRAVSVEIGGTSKTSFDYLCEIYLENCSDQNIQGCFCVRNENPHLYYLYINFTASYKMSEHLVVLTISSLYQIPNITSNAARLPKIYGKTPPTMHVNNYVLSHSSTSFSLGKTKPNIRLCCYDSPNPCLVTITRNDKLVAQNVKCATFHEDSHEKANYNFTFILCGNKNESISFFCQVDLTHYLPTRPYTNKILFTAFSFIIISGLLIIFFIKWFSQSFQ
ncbi:hypothetical protein Btru_061207 [Bulinus truncatus]|nr:hypothetical protein Btru_061207 [Bulinus truncatus]